MHVNTSYCGRDAILGSDLENFYALVVAGAHRFLAGLKQRLIGAKSFER